jgi:hypothetical protein
MGFEVKWNGYVQLSITVLMERTLLSGVNLLRGDGDARFACFLSAGYVVIGLSNLDRGAATGPMIFFTRRMPVTCSIANSPAN